MLEVGEESSGSTLVPTMADPGIKPNCYRIKPTGPNPGPGHVGDGWSQNAWLAGSLSSRPWTKGTTSNPSRTSRTTTFAAILPVDGTECPIPNKDETLRSDTIPSPFGLLHRAVREARSVSAMVQGRPSSVAEMNFGWPYNPCAAVVRVLPPFCIPCEPEPQELGVRARMHWMPETPCEITCTTSDSCRFLEPWS